MKNIECNKHLSNTKINLEDKYIQKMIKVIHEHEGFENCEIYIYGSRARCDKGSKRSDIDIALNNFKYI